MGLDPRYGGGYGAVEPSAPEEPPAYSPHTPSRFGRTTGGPSLLPSISSFVPRRSPPTAAPSYDGRNNERWAGASRQEQEEAFALLPRQSSGQYGDAASGASPAEGPVGDFERMSEAPGGYMGVSKLLVGVYAILMGAMIYTNGGVRVVDRNRTPQPPSVLYCPPMDTSSSSECEC